MREKINSLVHHKQMPNGGSDRTLKKAIEPIENPLEKVLKLRPVVWQWKDEKKGNFGQGFIAQEVEKIIPYLVSEEPWDDGTMRKFLSTDGIMPYLVGAIHEQQKQIEELKEIIANIEKKS